MADSLSLLRQFTIDEKHIDERDDQIIFNEFAWNKDSLTNFISYSAEKKEKEYYSLGCLLYFLKHEHLSHPKYVQQAAGDKISVVRRPDRKTLLDYLHGKTEGKDVKGIDKTARLEMPTHVKRTAEDKLDHASGAKKTKLDSKASQQQIEQRLAEKLKAPQNAQLSINSSNFKDLSDKLDKEKLAAIRAKIIAQRRTRIKPEDEDAKAPSLGGFLESRGDSSSVFRNEKQWRTRTTILQSTGKTFSKSITAILSSVKAREEGKVVGGRPPQQTPRPGAPTPIIPPSQPQPRSLPNYNRYDQEQFHGKAAHGFNIETTGTFSGMTLRNVTEGVNQSGQNRNKQPQTQPNAKNSNGALVKSIPPSIASNNTPNSGGKRTSRTPIIIISAAPKSLITMYNAKEVLQDLRFVSNEEMRKGGKRENELLITRRKEGGLTVPYRVIDNPNKLTPGDWDRVVAVFVMGQAWQFKGWPYDGNPTVIFSKICGFHIKWDEMVTEKNIANWAVNIIQLSRTKRHLDRARLMVFWEILDKYMINNKPHLRF